MSALPRHSARPLAIGPGAPSEALAPPRAPSRIEVAWPVMHRGERRRLTFALSIAPRRGDPGAHPVLTAEAQTPDGQSHRLDPAAVTLLDLGADLFHLDVPGHLSATLRLASGRAPALLYARSPLLDADLPPGAADRPTLQVRPA